MNTIIGLSLRWWHLNNEIAALQFWYGYEWHGQFIFGIFLLWLDNLSFQKTIRFLQRMFNRILDSFLDVVYIERSLVLLIWYFDFEDSWVVSFSDGTLRF